MPASRVVQEAAEAALKDIWGRHPSNPQVTELMQEGIAQLQRPADLTDALATFAKAAQLDPMFAEAQNKKATVLFLLHRRAPASCNARMYVTCKRVSAGAHDWCSMGTDFGPLLCESSLWHN